MKGDERKKFVSGCL
ncbi:MAG: hypothetical protein HZC43_05375 [Nitrosomonadales bacterium]|nr:hypothetical protein [Nitrosomonadales bacterium]